MNVFQTEIQTKALKSTATLECWLLDMSPKLQWKARPAVLLCPGGAYEFTNDRESEPIAAVFLSKGFHVFSLRYSVRQGSWPAALLELAEAVKLIRVRAQEWYIDPSRLVIVGFSAGGHLAAEYCCKWRQPWLLSMAEAEAQQLKPSALVLG